MVTLMVTAVVALLTGVVVGFLARGHVSKWCPDCGAGLRCIPCTLNARQRAEGQQHGAGCR